MNNSARVKLTNGRRGHADRRRFFSGQQCAALLLAVMLIILCGCTVPALAAGKRPKLQISKKTVDPGETFSVSWHEYDAEGVSIWKRTDKGDYEKIADVSNSSDGYSVKLDRPGVWYLTMMASYNGDWRQSDEYRVQVRNPAKGKPKLKINKKTAETGESFSLSWNEPYAENVVLWRKEGKGEWEKVASVSNNSSGYSVSVDQPGKWSFTLMGSYFGEDKQSSVVTINIKQSKKKDTGSSARGTNGGSGSGTVISSAEQAAEEKACKALEQKGMNNVWNLLFVIYEKVDIDGFKKSFTQKDIAEIKWYASQIKDTMESVTNGRMRIGQVTTVEIPETIRSASSYFGDTRCLKLGPGGDVNFNDLLTGKDITYVVVYAPLAGLPGTEDWLGLSPFTVGSGYTECEALQINWVDRRRTYYKMEGKKYSEEITVIVHELLHGVENNSRRNGWSDFEPLHNVEENGYKFEHSNLLWYKDLTRDQIKNGHRGFRRDSFYVRHR